MLFEVAAWLEKSRSDRVRPTPTAFAHLEAIFSSDTSKYGSVAKDARNKIGFHLLSHETQAGLRRVPIDTHEFASGIGGQPRDMCYDFANFVAFLSLAKKFNDTTEDVGVLSDFYTGVVSWARTKTIDFVDAANAAMLIWLRDRGVTPQAREGGN